jgi:hypothetical protein
VFSYPAKNQKNIGGFQPCICSELFFEKKKSAQSDPILFICNDAWLGLDYAKDLAKRSAQLYNLLHQVLIVYVGSYGMEIIT